MCLHLTRLQCIPKIATKDIVVYKHVAVRGGSVFTPIREMKINSKLIIPEEKKNLTLKDYFNIFLHKRINGKFIHAFREFGLPYPGRFYGAYDCSYCIKCIIPKGTIYYKNDIEVASRKLEIIDIKFLKYYF